MKHGCPYRSQKESGPNEGLGDLVSSGGGFCPIGGPAPQETMEVDYSHGAQANDKAGQMKVQTKEFNPGNIRKWQCDPLSLLIVVSASEK